jgi:hypothetical protein
MYNQLINEAEVQKTWGPIITEATGVEDREKLSWMSKYCHYHNLNESVWNQVHLNPNVNVPGMGDVILPGDPGTLNQFANQFQGSGDRPFSLLPLAMQVAAQTVGLDLVPVVPMQGPMGVLTYLDFVYAGGRIQGGDFASPLMLKVPMTSTGEIAGLTTGDVIYAGDPLTNPTGSGVGADMAWELTFIKLSRIDGFPIFRVRGWSGTHDIYQQGAEGQLPSGLDIPESINTGMPYFATNVTAGAVAAGFFDGPAELVKALEDHVTGFSGDAFEANNPYANDPAAAAVGNAFPTIDGNDPYLRGDGEQTPDNLIGLNLFNKSVAAQTFQVAAGVTREQVQDLKQFGIDAVAQVEAVLVNELTQSINKLILERIFRNGATNAQNVQNVDGFNLCESFTIGAGNATFNLGPGNANNLNVTFTKASVQVGTGGETQGTLQRRLLSKILASTNLISIRGRRGPATFAVVGGQIGTALQDIAGFVPYPLSNTVNQAGGSLYPIGAIAGVTIYVDPTMSWNDTRVAIGRKGDGNSPGLVFMPYLMAESVETIAEGTMAPKIAVKSRFALVDAGFHPETMYYTLQFLFGAGVEII